MLNKRLAEFVQLLSLNLNRLEEAYGNVLAAKLSGDCELDEINRQVDDVWRRLDIVVNTKFVVWPAEYSGGGNFSRID
jgi:hypothetical protein